MPTLPAPRQPVIIMRLLRRKSGAIFIDAMLGVYILAILGLMFAAITMAALISRTMADERTKAATIVNRQLESLKNVGYGNLTYTGLRYYGLIDQNPTAQPFSFSGVGSATERVSELLPSGTGAVTVADVSASLRQVTVTVSWESRTGARTVTASTRMAQLR
jgi:hypothetical protein